MNKMMLKKQYMMYSPKKKGRLPSEYQEVEYIEKQYSASNSSYINSGITASNDLVVEAELFNEIGTTDGACAVFGSRVGFKNKDYTLNFTNAVSNGTKYDSRFGSNAYNYGSYLVEYPKNYHILTWGNGEVKINGETKLAMDNTSFQSTLNVFLFAGNSNGSVGFFEGSGKTKVKWLKMTKNGVLVRNFIPCYRKSDNEIGMYDLVNNQFYTNQGSGSFLKGKDVIYTSTNAVSFATDSWETIQAEAERISNFYEKYGFIPFNTPYGIYNPENNDTNNIRTITYNNEEIEIAIIGMCHDTLQTPYSGGGTKAGITWQTTKSLFKQAVDTSTAYGGWYSCSLRASLNTTHFNLLSQEMQNSIKVVAKKSNNGNGSTIISNDKLFTLSMVEIMGTTKQNSTNTFVLEDEGTQYEYYKNAPLIKDSNNITWTALSGTKGTCIANGNSYMTLIGGVQTPDANYYVNYRNAKIYKPNGNASYYGTRTYMKSIGGYVYVWRAGNVSYTTSSNSDLEVCFAGCI